MITTLNTLTDEKKIQITGEITRINCKPETNQNLWKPNFKKSITNTQQYRLLQKYRRLMLLHRKTVKHWLITSTMYLLFTANPERCWSCSRRGTSFLIKTADIVKQGTSTRGWRGRYRYKPNVKCHWMKS